MKLRPILISLAFFSTAGLFSAFGTGCVVDATPAGATRYAYEACNSGDYCPSPTACTTAMYSVSGSPGGLCTVTCTQGPQCPVSIYGSGYLPTCIVSASVGSGLCYDTCLVNSDCGGATICATIPGTTVRVCVPR